jgi:hypothetical protein
MFSGVRIQNSTVTAQGAVSLYISPVLRQKLSILHENHVFLREHPDIITFKKYQDNYNFLNLNFVLNPFQSMFRQSKTNTFRKVTSKSARV